MRKKELTILNNANGNENIAEGNLRIKVRKGKGKNSERKDYFNAAEQEKARLINSKIKVIRNVKRKVDLFFILKVFSLFALLITIISLLAVILFVLIRGVPNLSFQLLFGEYKVSPSILPAIIGTLQLVAISLIIAVPIGVFTAVYLVEYTNSGSKFVKIIRITVETLAGIPSIVYGLFGYLVFVVALKMGYSILGGGITLAIMIMPVIVRSTEESLLAVPMSFREGAFALGAGKPRTIFKVIIPSARRGVVTGIILAAGRVISESAVLILTIGMVVNKVPTSLMSPGTSLALDIYYFASHGYPEEASGTAVVLLVLVLIINKAASLVGKERN